MLRRRRSPTRRASSPPPSPPPCRSPPGSVLGPAPLFRLRGRHRLQLLIKAADRAVAVRAVGDAVERLAREAARRGVSLSVDVDPV